MVSCSSSPSAPSPLLRCLECSFIAGKHVKIIILIDRVTVVISVCHYVSSTRLRFFEKGTANDAKDRIRDELMKFVKDMGEPEKEEKKGGSRINERRKTIAKLVTDDNKNEDGQVLNLRKNFKVKFQGFDMRNVAAKSDEIIFQSKP